VYIVRIFKNILRVYIVHFNYEKSKNEEVRFIKNEFKKIVVLIRYIILY